MRSIALADGEAVPVLGQGTWEMGEARSARRAEAMALRQGFDLGMTLVDTAEMYAEGGAEEVVAEAVAGRRDEVFIVSKVCAHNASRDGTIAACERSLKRLRSDRIDLYLLHWRGSHPLADTVAAFEALKADGKIRHWGVSNFDRAAMAELWAVAGGRGVAANQVLYNLSRRGIEWDLLPWCRERGIPVMAYSPLEQGRFDDEGALSKVAKRHGVTPFQVALAWVLQQDGVLAIPKTANSAHLKENRATLDIMLTQHDLDRLEADFPLDRDCSHFQRLVRRLGRWLQGRS